MTPRNTQLGASASALRAPSLRVPAAAPSSRTRKTPATRARIVAARPAGRGQSPRARATAAAQEYIAHRWWLLPVVIVAVVSLFIAAYYPVARVQYRETRARAALQSELDAIRARNERMRADVARLRTPEGVEDYARLQLGMVKKGEHQIIVVDGTETTAALSAATGGVPKIDSQVVAKPPVGPWTAFLDAFFGVQ